MKNIFKNLHWDLSASVVVFLIALPLCLGIAMGSGAPLFAGIIAGIVGGIVVGSLSGSQTSVTGPAAGLTVIVASGIANLPGYQAFLLAVVLAGVFQVLLGYLKAGVVGDYIPYCVITGMLAAIGIILILKQTPHFMGHDVDFDGDESFIQGNRQNTFTAVIESVKNSAPLAIIIGVVSLFIQITWNNVLAKKAKIFKLIPAPLIVVLVAVAINYTLSQQQHPWALKNNHLVNIPSADSVTGFLSLFTMPDFGWLGLPAVWITAITIALVASLETLVNIEAADEFDPYRRATPTNRELRAQGVGNIVSGMIGGLPMTSVIVRSSANVNAGARSKLSAIFHGVLLLLCVAFIPALLNHIPLSAVAAILIYMGLKLAKPAIFKRMYNKGYDQFVPFLITIVAIIFTDLLIGIMIGIVSALIFILRTNFKTSVFVVNDENNYLIRLRKDVSFLNKPILKNELENLPANSYVLIDVTRADFIDKDIIEVINDYMRHAHLKKITVEIKRSANKPVHQLLQGVL